MRVLTAGRPVIFFATAVLASTGGSHACAISPNDLGLPVETPRKQPNVLNGAPAGMTETVCIKSGGTVAVNPDGKRVCATKVNALLGNSDPLPKPSHSAKPTKSQ